MRLTVIGSGPAAPQPDTPASGLLVESGATSVLFDCGSGVIIALRASVGPRMLAGVVIGHLHADHFIDLAALRYAYPWPGTDAGRPLVWLPPGGRDRLTTLAGLISERRTFFDDAFDVMEYADNQVFAIRGLAIRPVPMRHYVPAWAMSVTAGGERLVYGGDTGPTDALVEVATGADLLVAEATLASVGDDEPRRGHSTPAESIQMARQAGVPRLLLTHYQSARRGELANLAASTPDMVVKVAQPGSCLEVRAGDPIGARQEPQDVDSPGPGAGAAPGSEAASSRSIRPRSPGPAGSSPSRPSAIRK